MKKYFLLVLLSLSINANPLFSQSEDEFFKPPVESQARTWWRWLGNNISKDGISKDLEDIKDKGMNGVTLFNLGSYYPKGDVVFMTDEWIELFDYSIDKCEELGLDFSFQICDGWGASGGPWVTKDNAMKVVTSSKVTVEGGKNIDVELPQPHTKLDYYKDLKVLAFPAYDKSDHLFTAENVKVTFPGWSINPENLIDGDRYTTVNFGYKKGDERVIDFELLEPFTFDKINVHHGDRESPVGPLDCEIQYSNDGKTYTTLGSFVMDDLMGGTSFVPTKAKYFRLKFNSFTSRTGNGGWVFLSEVELLAPESFSSFPQLKDFEIKASIWHRKRGLLDTQPVDDKIIVKKEQIIDISEYFNNGKLNWEALEGHWTIVRIGYTLTGRNNGPATDEGRGLECDKLNKESVELFYNGYAGKLLKRNKEHCGKTITRLFADSFEALASNWTSTLSEEFKTRTGYDMMPYLLSLTGEVVESLDVTERFLFDFRKVLSEMLADNYYAYLNELCHKDNVKFVAQASGEQQMLINPMFYSSKVDFPATEFWIGGKWDDTYFKPNGSFYDAISSSHVFGKKIIPTEAFTMNWSDFSVTPQTMKPIGDKAFALGINQFEMHTYIHQPDEQMPGWQHYMFGIAWGRKITWWDAADDFTKYFARTQNILQQGDPVADILLYTGEVIPNSLEFAYNVHDPYEIVPKGYKFDGINSYVLLNMISVKDGMFFLPCGLKYKVLMLPPSDAMSLEVIKKIKTLVEAGGIVVGNKPEKCFGLNNLVESNEELKKISDKLWAKSGENIIGKGKVYKDVSLQNVLEKEFIKADFSYRASKTDAEVLFYHKRIGENEVYFITNQEEESITIEAIFRQADLFPKIWYAIDGNVTELSLFYKTENTTVMPLSLAGFESCFVVFSKEDVQYYTELYKNGELLFPFGDELNELPAYVAFDELIAKEPGKYMLLSKKGDKKKISVKGTFENIIFNEAWTVEFDKNRGFDADITFDKLISWTESESDWIKYFSGTVVYKNKFEVPEKYQGVNCKLILDLGEVKDVAKVYISGEEVTTFWSSDNTVDISDYFTEGVNLLEVHVSNTWNNRIAGDDMNPKEKRHTGYPVKSYSPTDNRRLYDENYIFESGLLGPVKIMQHYTKLIE